MEVKINIVEILKDKPQGIKLYSSACGKCKLEEVDDKSFKISFYNSKFGFMNGGEGYLDKNGKLYDDGECIIFPSKEMRDWSKFAWKKGDVLINSCGFQCIFKEWASDDYTKFNGCYSNSKDGYEDVSNAETAKFVKLDNNIAYGYVREIERKLGGILNLETLEIEKTQPEFKDGDIVVYGESVAICRRFYKHTLSFYISLNEMFGLLFADEVESSEEYRFATEEEKQQLFDALEKEGKAWDAEKKQIVDIKKEHQFKPFEKVLVRDSIDDVWRASFFSHIKENDGRYVTTCVTWKFCIPYIGNESLVGTIKDVEG
jgi:hypothetical protein|nr:MAG TPA: hypothetical protein [Caudoviricetes sp.]